MQFKKKKGNNDDKGMWGEDIKKCQDGDVFWGRRFLKRLHDCHQDM